MRPPNDGDVTRLIELLGDLPDRDIAAEELPNSLGSDMVTSA
ncbi:hypothetical protein [Rhizobium acidisoli]|nr:hypothetical protein [Rhizobium acidisoli]